MSSTQRPILAGCHPDPSICRVGAWFYLVASSFEYVPGVPVYRSRDLRGAIWGVRCSRRRWSGRLSGPTRLETDDGTTDDRISPIWISPGQHPAEHVTPTPAGWRITAHGDREVAFVGRRQQHRFVRARARLDATAGTGGLSLWVDPRHHYDVEVDGRTVRAIAQIGAIRHVLAERPLDAPATLQIHTEPATSSAQLASAGPDVVVLGLDGLELARLDGRYLSTEVAGGFTGRMIGPYTRAGQITLTRWEYAGDDEPP